MGNRRSVSRLAAVLSVLLILASLAACAQINKARLVGTWQGELELLGASMDTELTLNKDGTGRFSTVMDLGVALTYTLEGDALTIIPDTPIVQKALRYTVAFSDGNMLLTDETGKVVTLTPKK